ncbi:PRD domain-containing protein [Lactobacillus sp. ESL0684]|uniref:PRD domain-containing protein n=1 Tax=unclassified Lactobacillus TaxID=2620435 RepID=UPI0023F88356|nr:MULTISPECIES: PRD domain-containing protein [unclassified Lactobacillus]WEV39707.1 PRD domain-containing protein [Lactobacillus sp. ESL0681]WEV43758.1 PRD domain-containing protein [Lactobacillus sp. ESL0684]
MKFIKNFNNNAALVSDESGVDWVVIGNGIGFGKKAGDAIDEAKITRRFVAVQKNIKMIDSVSNIDARTLNLTTDVIDLASKELNITFSDYQYLSLADHIDFMFKRADEHLELGQETVRWEVGKLFPKEFQVAKKALQLMRDESKLDLPKSETVLLTYHFINADSDQTKLQDTIKITKLVRGVVAIIEYQYGIQLDTESFNFSRFMTHLRSFMVRHITSSDDDIGSGQELDSALLKLMQDKYPKAYATVLKIGTYLHKQAGWDLQPDDEVYLTLHVWRVTHRQSDIKEVK